MTYDEFKQNFLPEFLDIKSYAGRIKYADEHLQRIGSGSGRIVYNIGDEKAFKLAKNPKGIAQNETEANTGGYRDTQHIVTEVFEEADNYTWLISELAKKVTQSRIKELTGIPSLSDLFYFLRNNEEQVKGRRKIYGQDKELEQFFWENEFSYDLANFIANYSQSSGDMGRPSTYGEVLRDGQPAIVLTDYGINDEVYDTHYNPQRKQQYQMYELFNNADGNDDILSDIGGGQDIRNGMWAQMPYSVSDGQGVINEKFIHFVSNRNKYPNKPISGLPVLADGFHETVNNIKPILKLVEDKKQFYSNLLELQNYLMKQGYYNRDPLLSEEYVINEEIPDVEQYSLEDRNESDEFANAVAGKLGLTSPRYLGGGANGFAYEINNNLVLKLTSDISEADAASRLLRGRPKNIAEIYNLYKIHDTVSNKSFFAILQENINDKPLERLRKLQNDISLINLNGMDYIDIMFSIKKPKKFDYNQMVEFAKQLLTVNPEANVSQQDRQAAYEYLIEMFNMRQELIDFGIKSVDYIEIGNLGYKNGKLKFFDTGGYRGVSEPDIKDDTVISLPEDGSAKFSSDDAIGQDGFPTYNTNDTTPSINNNLNANSGMYEDLEYNHVKGDATDDEYMLGESDIYVSKEDYQRISDDKILNFIEDINNYANQIRGTKYLSAEDLSDIKYLIYSMQYNKNRYSTYMGADAYDNNFSLFYNELKKNNIISEERKKSYMAGSKAVDVKKKCRIGGLGNTSVACNQGDINNLIFKSIKEEIQNNLELKEYFSSLVPMNEEGIMSLQDLPFKQEVEQLGGKIFSVGGAVRDEFLGKESKDLDILVTGIPMDELEAMLSKYGRVDKVGASFGVLKFIPKGATEEIDIAIPRTETPTGAGGHQGFDVKSDHELPIEKDLERRDFTINAIAKDIDNNLIDPYNGQEDLKNKIIRIVNPEAFSDDPLRMLRAVQFASRFGFTIEPKTMQMIIDNADKVKEIAPERILIEFDKIIKKGNILTGVELLVSTGLFKQIFGNQIQTSQIGRRDFNGVRTMAEFLFLMMYGVVQNPAEFYLSRFSTEDAKRDKNYRELQALDLAFNSSLVDQQMDGVKARSIAHNMFKIAPQTLESKILPEIISNAGQELLQGKYPKTVNELAVNGNDIMQKGLNGKDVGNMQKSMLIWIYADKIRNEREELLSLVTNKTDDMQEGYANYSEPVQTWNINDKLVEIDFFVKEYDKWNTQNGKPAYPNASRPSVLEFLQNNYEDESTDEKLNKELYWALTDRDLLKENDEKKTEGQIEYGCLMLYLNIDVWNKITSIIKKEDLFEKNDEYGIETEPHLTILYGFHDSVTAEKTFDLYKETVELKPIEVKTDGISIFENEEFDVVKLDVESKLLTKLNGVMKELPNTSTYPEYHAHITIAYVKKGEGKKYVKKFSKEQILKGNKLVFSTKKEENTTLSLDEKGLLKEDKTMNKISYSGVVLDDKSRTKLIKVFERMIPKDWEIIARHMTIKLGGLEDGSKEKQDMEDETEIHLNVTDYAIDDKVMAVGVKGYESTNAKAHITMAVNRAEGGKPFMSNKLTDWRKIGFSFDLNGKIVEVGNNSSINESKKKSKYKNTKVSLMKSKAISKDMKNEIAKYVRGGSTYHEGGHVHGLSKPQVLREKSTKVSGVSMGADKNGFYVYTHRARSKSHPTPDKITVKEITFIESTG